ncbi:hypothetical protein PQX77_015352 [Marasmius sp. AFHP31]|nr:hypothetical protein PQX77_015352 [Marasmius sp. AFHP31]
MQDIHKDTVTQNSDGHVEVLNIAAREVFNKAISNPHQALWNEVASVGASHDSEHRSGKGGCIKGTRERILRMIYDWILGKVELPIFWLSGVVGVGKSAIAMTVAKWCEEEGRLVSSFFFSRNDPKRNNPSALVPSIARGLAMTIPSMRGPIEQRILDDPEILNAKLEDQFRELVLKPVQALTQESRVPNVVVIDGLDESGDEQTQLRVLSTIQSAYHETSSFPLRLLICSRYESWIRDAFDTSPLHQLSQVVSLDHSFEPDKDLTRYYRQQFQEIVESPRYAHIQFPSPWPSDDDLEQQLIPRSCGQFAHASGVVKFIRLADRNPTDQLHLVLGHAAHDPTSSPYSELDTQYNHILNAVSDPEKVLGILAALAILPPRLEGSPACIELVLGLPSGQVTSALRAMHSVVSVHGSEDAIRFYHMSFMDYLLDRARSGKFWINLLAQKHRIAGEMLRNVSVERMGSYSSDQFDNSFFVRWIGFCVSLPRPAKDLLDELRNVDLEAVFFCKYRYRVQEASSSQKRKTVVMDWRGLFGELMSWVAKADDGGGDLVVQDIVRRLSNPPET